MKFLIIGYLIFAYFCKIKAAVLFNSKYEEDVGKPLLLTELIENGKIEEAQRKALVRHHEMKEVESYAGFITIDKRYNSNSFFWFFLSKLNPKKDPILMWLNGGPASSSMAAIFNYNGPYFVHKNQTIGLREHTLTENHNVIYLDNPVGTGFSFTDSKLGYAKNQSDIDRDIVKFLVQFFQLFPEYHGNDFYVIGDSYSGKYCATLPMAIKRHNDDNDNVKNDKSRINIKGTALGNGMVDLQAQMRPEELVYQIGLVDHHGREKLKRLAEVYDLLVKLNDLISDPLFYVLSMKIKTLKQEYFIGTTGYEYNQNFLITKRQEDKKYYESYIVTPHVRRAIHVGDVSFDEFNMTAQWFITDQSKAETQAFEQTLDNFKVLIYNGLMDMIAPYSASEEYYRTLNWAKAAEYEKAERKLWHVDGELAGYWKTAGNLQEVAVRNSGHVVSNDQPSWYCKMMTRFTRDNIP